MSSCCRWTNGCVAYDMAVRVLAVRVARRLFDPHPRRREREMALAEAPAFIVDRSLRGLVDEYLSLQGWTAQYRVALQSLLDLFRCPYTLYPGQLYQRVKYLWVVTGNGQKAPLLSSHQPRPSALLLQGMWMSPVVGPSCSRNPSHPRQAMLSMSQPCAAGLKHNLGNARRKRRLGWPNLRVGALLALFTRTKR